MSLPDAYAGKESRYGIVAVPFEGQVTYGKGASKGPDAIIEASQQLEYYDEQFDVEPFEKGIRIVNVQQAATAPEMIKNVQEVLPGNFVIGLGGDHSVTLGLTQHLPKDVSVLIFDAHSDLRNSWKTPLNHACVARKLSEKHSIGIVGVRSQDRDEIQTDNVHVLKKYDITMEAFQKVLHQLNDTVYISIDVDVFDPAFIRNTGTPEPGGLFWDDLIGMLQTTFKQKNVCGCDVVEFAPEMQYRSEAYALAKLCYKITALHAKYCLTQNV